MANQETQQLDQIVASRRAMLLGGAALAAMVLPTKARAAATVSSYTDTDILNFALNLEYLEANFYYNAAFGTGISTANAASTAAGAAVIPTTGTGTQGSVIIKSNPRVPFFYPQVAAYATETAVEEGKHVLFLQQALGSSAVAQPAINLMDSFTTLAMVAGFGGVFDPFDGDRHFLVGAYIFEDVGVTAYHGAAPLISTTSTGKTYLQAAAGILAVEAYHAGVIRTAIMDLDPTGAYGLLQYTQKISLLRATLSAAVAPSPASPFDPNPDDVPLTTGGVMVSLAGGASVQASTIVNADPTNVIAFARTTTQVLNIVTGGGAATTGTPAKGLFFPNGLNGTFV